MPLEEIFTREVVIEKVEINNVDNNIAPINKLRPKHDRQYDESHSSTRDDMLAAKASSWQESRQANADILADLLVLLANELNHLIHLMDQDKQKKL